MGCGAPVNRRRPCPYYCGRRLWTVNRGFFGCGITGDVVRRPWELEVMLLDRCGRSGCACRRPFTGHNGSTGSWGAVSS